MSKNYHAERKDFKGRFCPCGAQATCWNNGYCCDRCRKLEATKREFEEKKPRKLVQNHEYVECIEPYKVHR